MASEGSKTTVIAALAGNGLIAVAKITVAIMTGSAAMLSEGYHSVADVGNQALLLWGIGRAKVAPTPAHPFGRGKEIYFWSFMVAVMLFVGGSVLAVRHGIDAIRNPHEITKPVMNFVVLGIAMVTEGTVFSIALRHFNKERGTRSAWRSVRVTKDTSTLVVLLEDSAAMIGLFLAFVGIGLTMWTGNAIWDGIASLAIGALLGAVAWLLAVETKALLIGEAASRSDRASMRLRILAVPQVESVGRLLTMHMGPDEILVNIDVDLVDGLMDDDVERAIDRVEAAIREVLPEANNIFVELESHRD